MVYTGPLLLTLERWSKLSRPKSSIGWWVCAGRLGISKERVENWDVEGRLAEVQDLDDQDKWYVGIEGRSMTCTRSSARTQFSVGKKKTTGPICAIMKNSPFKSNSERT